MKRKRRKELRSMAFRECAEIIESALGVDLGIFSEGGITKDEADVVENVMRKVSDELYARADKAGA